MRLIVILLLTVVHFIAASGQKYTVSGYVEDQNSGERFLNANVYDPVSFQGVISNNYGFYSLTLPSGAVKITYSYVGYQNQTLELILTKDTLVNIALNPIVNLDEVVISAQKARSAVESTQISMTELNSKEIKSIPVLFGEVDVLKALQLLPGVQSWNEGTSGI